MEKNAHIFKHFLYKLDIASDVEIFHLEKRANVNKSVSF